MIRGKFEKRGYKLPTQSRSLLTVSQNFAKSVSFKVKIEIEPISFKVPKFLL